MINSKALVPIEDLLSKLPEGMATAKNLLAIAASGKTVSSQTSGFKTNSLPQANRIIIVAGHGLDIHSFDGEYNMLFRVIEHLEGLIISGGTQSGLPGMLGQIAAEHNKSYSKSYSLIGYLPEACPLGAKPDERYDQLFRTPGADNFSEAEPIQIWIDLIASGVDPSSVCLLGINGGKISAFEYELALAMGARVGLIEGSGRSADQFLSKHKEHSGIYPLSKDYATVSAFLRPKDS